MLAASIQTVCSHNTMLTCLKLLTKWSDNHMRGGEALCNLPAGIADFGSTGGTGGEGVGVQVCWQH